MKHISLKSLLLLPILAAAPAFGSTPDALITAKAKLTLWTTTGIRSSALHVDTNDGMVTLHGKVTDADQKGAAERAVREINGVRAVNDLLQVVAPANEKRVEASDRELLAVADRQLHDDPLLKESHITVKSVDKGVVLLSGEAKTLSDRLWAVTMVDRIPGVRRVASEITGPEAFGTEEKALFGNEAVKLKGEGVRVGNSALDLRITTDVKLHLLTAAQVPSSEISVDTQDGVVTLFGIVPTDTVKRAAGDEAGKARGVVKIENELEVVSSPQKAAVEAKDADITRDLTLAFRDRSDLKGVSSSVKNGTVQLTGTVASGWDEVAAVRAARRVAGVRSVEDQLKVK